MRALLWENGVMTDLNTLIPAGSPWYLQSTATINNAGEITGQGLINGEVHAFLLTPRHGEDAARAQGATHKVRPARWLSPRMPAS